MVARPYLRTPRARVIQVTQLLHRKQQDFLLALSRGVIPDEIVQSGLEPRFVQHLNLYKLLLFCCCCGVLFYFDIHPITLCWMATPQGWWPINTTSWIHMFGWNYYYKYCYYWLDSNQAKLATHLKSFKTLLKRWCSWDGSSFFLWAVV